ncbi:MAG: glycosyltransferase family 2 protein [Candidatus Magasanikbacteria bacterium CG10_big_fil_rev_8_21_14_0_10_43_6]|uniref:Glycosyltransferase family 2 protein n=1 Tax=Candidatus Magasanikbacteria bacterium CG10_big_fil_rev_8_21_14_0_10_43_6 TaxID=1974650 RepID=A0A2M6W2G7_9BACT|nr:MAG: glycosyltransferase family 2 protein [Candidatus Magasanikbacteria bacterium CG10_big_fil_rev_8_21_14_0_10_43_6]
MFIAIVPAYNEEKRIGSVVRSLFHHVDTVVVVDDASKDNTAAEARRAGAHVLVHRINRGQGAALETGHMYAREHGATYVLHFDGDGQFQVEDIAPALAHLQKTQADMLLGSRYLDGRSKLPWLKRHIIHPLGKLMNKIFANVTLSDAHNGFRILNKRALMYIVIGQDRMAHATEIPYLAQKHGLTIVEFPVKVVYHEYGQKMSGGFWIIRDLLIGRFIR